MAFETDTRGRRPENAAWFLALILILVAGLVVWAAMSLRIDLFTEAIKREEVLSVLVVVDDGERPVMTEVLYYHPVTNAAALVDIPLETGTLIESIDKVSRLETIYNPRSSGVYREALAGLLGQPIDFFVRTDLGGFESLVDLLGGLDVFIPNAIDDEITGTRYLFPPGGVQLDGAKAVSFLMYRPEGETLPDRTDREHRVLQALLRKMSEKRDLLLGDDVLPYMERLLDTDLDRRSLISFLNAVSTIDADRLVMQGVLGNIRRLEGQLVLFPYYDGKLISETVSRIGDLLGRPGDFEVGGMAVRVEILNGTTVNGLASRTAQLFKSYGFRVAAVGNAENGEYERTVVLDRKGDPDASKRVADLVRCRQIHSSIDENRDETVDVTIILGKDFDGRYVKE